MKPAGAQPGKKHELWHVISMAAGKTCITTITVHYIIYAPLAVPAVLSYRAQDNTNIRYTQISATFFVALAL